VVNSRDRQRWSLVGTVGIIYLCRDRWLSVYIGGHEGVLGVMRTAHNTSKRQGTVDIVRREETVSIVDC